MSLFRSRLLGLCSWREPKGHTPTPCWGVGEVGTARSLWRDGSVALWRGICSKGAGESSGLRGCVTATRMTGGSFTCAVGPSAPSSMTEEEKGAKRKAVRLEVPGHSSVGGLSFPARCPGLREPFWEERHKNEFQIWPGSWGSSMAPTWSRVKQEKGLKPGRGGVGGGL